MDTQTPNTVSPNNPPPAAETYSLAETLQAREAALRIAEKRYRRLFEANQDGVLLLNAWTGLIEDANPAAAALLGTCADALLGQPLWQLDALQGTAINRAAFAALQQQAYCRHDNLKLHSHDGRQIFVEFVSTVYDCEGIALIQCNLRDISARVLAEKALRMTARALRVIGEVNTALLNAPDEQHLLREICQVLVETGGYRFAWVGFAEHARLTPAASFGADETAFRTDDASEPGRVLAATAIASGTMQFVEDLSSDPRTAHWHATASQRGCRSLIALPFAERGTGLLGCIVLYAGAIEIWHADERQLLQDLINELIYGLVNLRQAAAYRQREAALRDSLEQTVQALAATIDAHTSHASGHPRRVAELCVAIARELKLDDERIHGLRLAASIYDVGKLHVPLELLTKPTRLSAEEFALIRQHCQTGFDTVQHIRFPWPVAQTILQHHEHLDGSGYPAGLQGEALLLEARILSVADVVDAMTADRPHRPAPGIAAALAEINAHRGDWYDPDVVDACGRLFSPPASPLPGVLLAEQ